MATDTALVIITVTCTPDCNPTLQPPGSGRNTPIVRVSERNGLTAFFPGETDRKCIQGTCPVAVCSDPAPGPECVEVRIIGYPPYNTDCFAAPGFDWGDTPSFILIPPGEPQEGILFEWMANVQYYYSEDLGGWCWSADQEEGWTFISGAPGSPSICAIVSAVCE